MMMLLRLVVLLLAAVGLTAIIMGSKYYDQYQEITQLRASLDPQAEELYLEAYKAFRESRDLADVMMWSFKVVDGVTPDDVVESLKSLATARNFFFVGESPFYRQAEAVTGEPYRYTNFLSFCDVRVGMQMADYNHKYTAFMPCRIAVVEDQQGDIWLHSMNLDFMIYGGKPLPPELREGAIYVRNTIYELMEAAAAGEF